MAAYTGSQRRAARRTVWALPHLLAVDADGLGGIEA
jgi:hypothetical protein